MHGSDRRPVGDSRTGIPTEATVRLAGTTLARHAVGAQWRALDSAHRRPVARTSLQVSALSDLSSAFPILAAFGVADPRAAKTGRDRKSTRLNSSHSQISYAVFCLKQKNI